MAAITTIKTQNVQALRIRTATAQATVGQTDWLAVPQWAQYMKVYFNVTATAGTTPNFLPQLIETDPISPNDSVVYNVGGFATTTGITSTGQVIYEVGPGITGIANATAAVATSGPSLVQVNTVLPSLVGIKITNDRADGNETYTYSVTAIFKGANR